MYQTYNYPHLLNKFRLHLRAENLSSSTEYNYLSDIRCFAYWHSVNHGNDKNFLFSSLDIRNYLLHLSTNRNIKQTKRRLSSLKKFITFCGVNNLVLADSVRESINSIANYLAELNRTEFVDSLESFLSTQKTLNSEQKEDISELLKEVYV